MFLGNPSARIRDILWDKALEKSKNGYILQIWDYPCVQGYKWRSAGSSRQTAMLEMEGLALVMKLSKKECINEDIISND